jgi:hypothetical protein
MLTKQAQQPTWLAQKNTNKRSIKGQSFTSLSFGNYVAIVWQDALFTSLSFGNFERIVRKPAWLQSFFFFVFLNEVNEVKQRRFAV